VHVNEPGCDVKARVKAGRIDTGRYERYIEIYREQKTNVNEARK
jgi:putative ribosome biogenesis GTPase RsgA